jgi:hypothetical protein
MLGALALLGAGSAAEAADAGPCSRLFLPEGYDLVCSVQPGTGRDDWELTVRPETGSFAWLSRLTLRPLAEPVDDPASWLRGQVKIDVAPLDDALTAFLNDQDNPFADSDWWQSLGGLKGVVTSFADLPLEACDEPREQPVEQSWEMACRWGVGSLHQYLTVRLVERDELLYALRIEAMNERRFKHFVAIANSF